MWSFLLVSSNKPFLGGHGRESLSYNLTVRKFRYNLTPQIPIFITTHNTPSSFIKSVSRDLRVGHR